MQPGGRNTPPRASSSPAMSSRDRASFDPPSTSGAVSASSGSEGEPLFPLRSMVTRSTNPKSRSPSPRSRRAVGGSSRLEAGPARAGRELRGLAGWAAGPGGAGMRRGLAARLHLGGAVLRAVRRPGASVTLVAPPPSGAPGKEKRHPDTVSPSPHLPAPLASPAWRQVVVRFAPLTQKRTRNT